MDDVTNEDNVAQAKLLEKYEKAHTRGIVGLWAFRLGGHIGVISVAHDLSKLFFMRENAQGETELREKMILDTWRHAVQSVDCVAGQYVAVMGIDGTVNETVMIDNLLTSKSPLGYLEAVHIAISPDGSSYVTDGFSGNLKEYKRVALTPCRSEKYSNARQNSCMKYSRNGKYIAIGHLDGGIEIVHADSFKVYHKYEVHSMRIRKIVFLPGDDRFLSGCDDHLIKLHSLSDFSQEGDQTRSTKAIRIYSAHNSPVTALTIDEKSGGTRFASSSASSQIFIWHIELTTPVMSVANDHTSAIRGLSFSPSSRHLFSGGDDAMLCLYSIPGSGDETPRQLQSPEPPVEQEYEQQENEPPHEYSQHAEQSYYTSHDEEMIAQEDYQQEPAPAAQYQEYNPYGGPRTPPQEDDDLGDYVYNTSGQQQYTPPQNEYDPAL